MRPPLPTRAGVIAACLLLLACDGSPTSERVPTALDRASGDGQSGPVGVVLPDPLVVRVTAADGRPVRGAPVRFMILSGGGTLSDSIVPSDRDGRAATRWTLGVAATAAQRVEAAVVGRAGLSVTFTATATPGAAARMVAVGPPAADQPAGAILDSLRVRVEDAHGNPVPGVQVSWSVSGGIGSVAPATSVTDAAGLAATQWTLGTTAGVQNLATARAAGVPDVVFAVATRALAPFALVVSPPVLRFATVGRTAQLAAAVTDRLGNPIPGTPIVWHSEKPQVAQVDATGRVSALALGISRVIATSGTLADTAIAVVDPFPVTVNATPDSSTVEVGATRQYSALASDSAGVGIPGMTFTWSSLDPAIVTVSASGLATAVSAGRGRILAAAGSGADTVLTLVPVPLRPDIAFVSGPGRLGGANADGSRTGFITQTPNNVLEDRPEWSPLGDRVAIIADLSDRRLVLVSVPGGTATNATPHVLEFRWSPDGTRIAFTRFGPNDDSSDLWIFDVATGATRTVVRNATGSFQYARHPAWSPDGQWIAFAYDGNVARVHPDGTGLDTVLTAGGGLTFGAPEWSPNGSRLVVTGRPSVNQQNLYGVNPDGTGLAALTASGSDSEPRWSPDGSSIVFVSRRTGNPDVWIMNADGSGETNLTAHPGRDGAADWSPDGTRIAFESNRTGNDDIFLMNPAGGALLRLTTRLGDDTAPSWRPPVAAAARARLRRR